MNERRRITAARTTRNSRASVPPAWTPARSAIDTCLHSRCGLISDQPEPFSTILYAECVQRGTDWLQSLLGSVVACSPMYALVERDRQAGVFKRLSGEQLHLGFIAAALATDASDRFVPATLPRPANVPPAQWSRAVYIFRAICRKDFTALLEWTLCRAIVIPCCGEIKTRLESSTVDADAWDVYRGRHAEARLRRLLDAMERRLRNGGGAVPSDETRSIVNESLGRMLSKPSWLVFESALDGHISTALRRDFLNEVERASAQKRTYDRPRAPHRVVFIRPGDSDGSGDEVGSVLPIQDQRAVDWEPPSDADLAHLNGLGEAGRFARMVLQAFRENPDAKYTDADFARLMDQTDRTIRNHRKKLTAGRELLLRLFAAPSPHRRVAKPKGRWVI